jgi:site-specific DNA recombinase
LISPEDFEQVQERLNQRRPLSESREFSPFLLSGLAYCGYCNNKLIGVTRKQRWRRKSDGVLHNAQYRYYQCGSRTNRSLCDYHTHRSEQLEAEVYKAIRDIKRLVNPRASQNGSELQHTGDEIKRLRTKARRLDRRLEQYLDAAAGGGMDRDKLQALGLAIANEQSQVEESLVVASREAEQHATEAERRRRREGVLRQLRDGWHSYDLAQRQQLLREALARIVVMDDGVELVLRA